MNETQIFLISDAVRINGADGSFIEPDIPASEKQFHNFSLTGAKNSTLSFQIGILPKNGKLHNLSITKPSLSDKNGNQLDKENFQFFNQWFHCDESSNSSKLIPDLLIPLTEGNPPFTIPFDPKYLAMPADNSAKSVDISTAKTDLPVHQSNRIAQQSGGIWVDVWIPTSAIPGEYTGTLTLNADNDEFHFTINCRILDITVPEKSRITADLNNYADSLSPHFSSLKSNRSRYADGSYLEIEQSFYRMSREHRCLFHNLPYRHSGAMPDGFAPEIEGEGKYIRVKSWEKFDAHFGPYLDGTAFSGCKNGEWPLEFMYLPFHLGWPANYEKWGKKGYRTEYRRILMEFVRHFEEKGWNSTVLEILLNHKKDYRFYPYTVDEIWYEHDQESVDLYFEFIRDIYDTCHSKFVFRMDSSNHYGNHFDHRFSDYCKMWVAGFGMFNWFPESVEVMRNKKNILWIYGSVLQELDESLNSISVWPLQTMMTGATGFTVWNTTGFGNHPLQYPKSAGGENLFYPGSCFGIESALPSIRLKVLRNAMQLTDLLMRYRATPLERELDNCVNRAFGFTGKDDWFCPKPDFVDTPPRYWDFDNLQGTLPPLYKGKTYRFFQELTDSVFALLTTESETKRQGVHFQFQ